MKVEFDEGQAAANEIIVQINQHTEVVILNFVPGPVGQFKKVAVGMMQIKATRFVAQDLQACNAILRLRIKPQRATSYFQGCPD